MSDRVDVSTVNKFDGTNFRQWKFQMKCALKAKGIYGVIDGTLPKPNSTQTDELAAWNKKDAQAMFVLTSAMIFDQITLVESCENAKDMMTTLESIFELKSEANKMILHEHFHQYKMAIGDSIAQHVSKIQNLAKQINDAGDNVSDMAIMTKILSTLPIKYRNVRQAWLSLDPSKQTINNLKARLLDEESNLQNYEETEKALVTLSINKKKHENEKPRGPLCYSCRKRGHISRNCREKKKKQEDNSRKQENYKKDRNETAFNVEVESNSVIFENETWIMDSGASAHMTYRLDFYQSLDSNFKSRVTLGNNQHLSVEGKGTIKIQKLIHGKWYNATINNVLYIPQLRKNLFSEGVLTEKGMKVVKFDNEANVFEDSKLVAVAVKDSSNTYKMLFRTMICSANLSVSDNLKLWHERCGHVNVKYIKQMVDKDLVKGIKFSDVENFFCESCVMGKQHKLPFKKNKDHVKLGIGERIYSDVCGPISTPSVQGMRYFVTFKDENSGYRVAHFIKHKSDVYECFKSFNTKIKTKFGHPVKVLHTDGGTEYLSNEFKSYLNEEGIEHEVTAPYTPEQNGRAERDNRTIVESARSMLHKSCAPKYLWAEAVNTAIYILNRVPTSQAPGKTPYEMWCGQKPTLDHLKVFGCDAYAHVPDEKRRKLDTKSEKYMFVGYDKNSTNYRLFNPVTRKIIVSRNVVFNETNQSGLKPTTVKIEIESDDVTDFGEQEGVENQVQRGEENEQEEHHESAEESDEIPNLRPQRNVRLPARFDDFHLNFVEIDIPDTYEDAIKSKEYDKWKKAIDEEYAALLKNNTWKMVEIPENKKLIESRWVFRVKRNQDGTISRYKARLCAKGYAQKQGIDYNEIYAPTTRYDSIRVLLAVANMQDYEFKQFDIKTAFLYGELEENIYMKPPQGLDCKEGFVCKLEKSLYGLKQSPRCWNKKFSTFLQNFGFKASTADKCVYVGYVRDIKVLLVIYVDDGLIFSSQMSVIDTVLDELKNGFEITITEEANYFVGIEIQRDQKQGKLFLKQSNYIKDIINRFGMDDANPVSTPEDQHSNLGMMEQSKTVDGSVPYRQAVGSLMFLATVTRPDISHAVGVASRFLNCPKLAHWNAVKRIIKYIIGTQNYGIQFDKNGDTNLYGFTDSDYASDIDTRRSTSGYVYKLCNGPITWSSKRQPTVTLSTTEAEYVAASQATKEAIWLQKLLFDIHEEVIKPTILNVDNQSSIKLIRNPEFHNRTKHIDVQYHFVRDKYEAGDIVPVYVNTREQQADIFTKPLPKRRFQELCKKLGIVEII